MMGLCQTIIVHFLMSLNAGWMLVILLPNFQTVVWLLVPPRLNLMENNKCWWHSQSVPECVQNRAEAKRSPGFRVTSCA